MCDTCGRAQEEYNAAAERLRKAQRELACYVVGKELDAFKRLWNESHMALKDLWRLREEMATHAATHVANAMSSGAAPVRGTDRAPSPFYSARQLQILPQRR
jgi:hypothetical protein